MQPFFFFGSLYRSIRSLGHFSVIIKYQIFNSKSLVKKNKGFLSIEIPEGF